MSTIPLILSLISFSTPAVSSPQLSQAVASCRLERVEERLERGFDTSPARSLDEYPIVKALGCRQPTIFDRLLDEGFQMPDDVKDALSLQKTRWFHRTLGWALDQATGETLGLHQAPGPKSSKALYALLEIGVVPDRYPEPEELIEILRKRDYALFKALTEQRTGTALCLAVERKDHKLLADLLAKNWPSAKCTLSAGMRPLDVAIRARDAELVELILGKTHVSKLTGALVTAALYSDLETMRLLTKAGAPGEYYDRHFIPHTPLTAAIEVGDLAKVDLLLNYGVEPSPRNPRPISPLALAIDKGRYDIALRLITSKRKSELRANKRFFRFDLEKHGSWSQERSLQKIVSLSAEFPYIALRIFGSCQAKLVNDFHRTGGRFAEHFTLHQAYRHCPTDRGVGMLDALLAQGHDIDSLNDEGDTLLVFGLRQGWPLDRLLPLLERGADPNIETRKGKKPLMFALDPKIGGSGHDSQGEPLPFLEKAQILMRFGADPNFVGAKNETALEILQSDKKGHVPLDGEEVARIDDFLDIPGVQVDLADNLGRTALMRAASRARWGLYNLLISYGADEWAEDHKGNRLAFYYWKGLTRDADRHVVRWPLAQVSYKSPYGFATGSAEIRQLYEEEFPEAPPELIKQLILGAYLGHPTLPYALVLRVEPALREVSESSLDEAISGVVWEEETLWRTSGIFTTEMESESDFGPRASHIAVVPWEPFPLVVEVHGPVSNEREMAIILEGFVEDLKPEPQLKASEFFFAIVQGHRAASAWVFRIGVVALGGLLLTLLLSLRSIFADQKSQAARRLKRPSEFGRAR